MVVRRFAFALLILSVSLFCINVVSAIPISSCQTISVPGNYELTGNITASGFCLEIAASDVHIDGRGFTITGPSSATGVYLGGSVSPVRFSLTNISLSGFRHGVNWNIPSQSQVEYLFNISHVVFYMSSSNSNAAFLYTGAAGTNIAPSYLSHSSFIRSGTSASRSIHLNGISNILVRNIRFVNGCIYIQNNNNTLVQDIVFNNSLISSCDSSSVIRVESPQNVSLTGPHFVNVSFPSGYAGLGKDVTLSVIDSLNDRGVSFIDSNVRSYAAYNTVTSDLTPFNLSYVGSSLHGTIAFLQPIGIHSGSNLYGNASSTLLVSYNYARIGSSPVYFNVPARITLNGITGVTNPQITRDGGTCGYTCVMESFSGGTAVFRVPGSGEYSVVQAGAGGGNPNPWDYDQNGVVNVQDIFAFLADWFEHA